MSKTTTFTRLTLIISKPNIWHYRKIQCTRNIVGPLIKDALNKGHPYKGHVFQSNANTFMYNLTSEYRTPLYKGQFSWSQHVLYTEVPLYVHCNPWNQDLSHITGQVPLCSLHISDGYVFSFPLLFM